MSKMGLVLLTTCLAWAAAVCRADEGGEIIVLPGASERIDAGPGPEMAPVEASAPAMSMAPEAAPATPDDWAASGHGCGGLAGWVGQHLHGCHCARRAWQWLTYYPERCPCWCSHCGHTCAPTCVPPLYTYFLWHCQAGCGAAGHHIPAHSAAVAPVTEGTVTDGTAVTTEGTTP
jgi:hypothetical protein